MDESDIDERPPRVVQPGEVALMLPDEFERRLAASALGIVPPSSNRSSADEDLDPFAVDRDEQRAG